MMRLREWVRPPRRLLVLFLATTLVLAGVLGWLGWRLVEQDRALQAQRIQERLERAADVVTASLVRKFTETERQLSDVLLLNVDVGSSPVAKDVRDDGLIVTVSPDGLSSYPEGRLLYRPDAAAPVEPLVDVFDSGEALEFRQKDYTAAAAAFRELARSKDPAVRGGALLRLARTLRKAHRLTDALAAYEALSRLGSTYIGGLPAELLARHARCEVLEEQKQLDGLHREASALFMGLQNGRWPLSRASYRYYAQESRRWLTDIPDRQTALLREQRALMLAAAVESVWDEWTRIRSGNGPVAGRRSLRAEDRSVLILWQSRPGRLIALIKGPDDLRAGWLAELQGVSERQRVRWGLSDSEGRPVLDRSAVGAPQQAVRTGTETGLPWTVRLASADPAGELNELALRRRLLLAALMIIGLIVLAGGYFSARAVTRELAVARLQSNFVSAVSHEFRTPLASILQLSELLVDDRVSSDARRREYYQRIQGESERLHRVVETLLDFGSMEAGARSYRFESVDPATAVRAVTEEFAQKVADRGYRVDLHLSAALPSVRADREALSLGLWNLLDNAVKYSPSCKTIWVEADREDHHVAIRVRDKGLGIAASDQKQIFKKFVRGENAQAIGVKGSGLGLALVHHIVAAHGGDLRVDSEPGAGSTFTMRLPAATS